MIELIYLKFYKREVSSLSILKEWLGKKFYFYSLLISVSVIVLFISLWKNAPSWFLIFWGLIITFILYCFYKILNRTLRKNGFLQKNETFGSLSKSLRDEQDKRIHEWFERELGKDENQLDYLISRLKERIIENSKIPFKLIGGAVLLAILYSYISDYAHLLPTKEELTNWYSSILKICVFSIFALTAVLYVFNEIRPLNTDKAALRSLEDYKFMYSRKSNGTSL